MGHIGAHVLFITVITQRHSRYFRRRIHSIASPAEPMATSLTSSWSVTAYALTPQSRLSVMISVLRLMIRSTRSSLILPSVMQGGQWVCKDSSHASLIICTSVGLPMNPSRHLVLGTAKSYRPSRYPCMTPGGDAWRFSIGTLTRCQSTRTART